MKFYKVNEKTLELVAQPDSFPRLDSWEEISRDEYERLSGTKAPGEIEPIVPSIDPLTETQLAVAELAQVVDENNTAARLALAELAGLVLGG